MVMSAVPRRGFSNSVGRDFEKHNASEIRRVRQKTFHIKPFVFLDKLEMHLIARRETVQVFSPAPAGLIFKIFGFHKVEDPLAIKDTGIESVEEIPITPFASEKFRMGETVYNHFESNVGEGYDLDDFLFDGCFGALVDRFHVKPMELVALSVPNGGKVQRNGG